MREVLFPRLIRLRADDELAHELVKAAPKDKVTLSEFARCELRNAAATRRPVSGGHPNHDGPGPFPRDRFLEVARAGRAAARSSGYIPTSGCSGEDSG
jgi:hypothetical protein